MVSPWHDTPSCPVPDCQGPAVLPSEIEATSAPAGSLACTACGHVWTGTEADVERCERAAEAWAVVRKRRGAVW